MALEGGEVNVRDEKNRLGIEVCHHFEDGHVVALLEDGHFHIHNWWDDTTGSTLMKRSSYECPVPPIFFFFWIKPDNKKKAKCMFVWIQTDGQLLSLLSAQCHPKYRLFWRLNYCGTHSPGWS